jgi:hypothetical protein
MEDSVCAIGDHGKLRRIQRAPTVRPICKCADEMTPSENAVAATRVEAARYAYEKLVKLPTPRCAAKRRASR